MKKMRLNLFLLVLSMTIVQLQGQNQVDEQGRKTGYWVVTDDAERKVYEANFSDGKPVGLMKRYHKNGIISAEMMFDNLSERCYTKMYYEMGKIAAEGWFVNRDKDSIWTYYSEQDGFVRIRESYSMGKLHGVSESYFPNGNVAEKVQWTDNIRNGTWLQYYDDGGLRSSGEYINGMMENDYKYYRTDSMLQLEGVYRNDLADGEWILYNEDGSLRFIYQYKNGKLMNEDELHEIKDEILDIINDLPDPDPTDDF